MPIGLLIGWLIGQIFVGIVLIKDNQLRAKDDNMLSLARAKMRVLGMFLFWTAIPAFSGTMIELIIR